MADNETASPPQLGFCEACHSGLRAALSVTTDDEDIAMLERSLRKPVTALKDCPVEGCLGRSLNQDVVADEPPSVEEAAASMSPVCRQCYKYYRSGAKWIREKGNNPEATRVAEIYEKLTKTDVDAECNNSRCYVKYAQHDHSQDEHKESNHGGPGHDNPDMCDCCECEAPKHNEVLGYIKKIEASYRELTVAHGVESRLREDADRAVMVENSVASCKARNVLKEMSKLTNELSLGGKKIETKTGRPLCVVDLNTKFECHHHKMLFYAPHNCDCVPMPCECSCCLLRHLEHSAQDYEEAVSRVRLGITKLRAAPKKAAASMPSSGAFAGDTDGCAMLGVRKAKHLKRYTQAQTDAHNSGR